MTASGHGLNVGLVVGTVFVIGGSVFLVPGLVWCVVIRCRRKRATSKGVNDNEKSRLNRSHDLDEKDFDSQCL